MNEETEGEHGDHDVYYRERHEVATLLEQTIHCSEFASERVNHREEVDSSVKQQEDDEESTAYRLNQLLSD